MLQAFTITAAILSFGCTIGSYFAFEYAATRGDYASVAGVVFGYGLGGISLLAAILTLGGIVALVLGGPR